MRRLACRVFGHRWTYWTYGTALVRFKEERYRVRWCRTCGLRQES